MLAISSLASPLLRRCRLRLYRDWCPDCNEAFGRERAHRGTDSLHQRLVPLISCDYLFITQKGVFSRNELPEEECDGALTVLVLYCSATRSIFAHAVPKKGVDSQGYSVEMIRDDVLWLGHTKVMIRSDNEPALLQVVGTALTALKMKGVTSSSEGSVRYDPQTNGPAENAVRLLKGSLRANLLSFE